MVPDHFLYPHFTIQQFTENDLEYSINLSTTEKPDSCPYCGSSLQLSKHDNRTQRLTDIPYSNKHVRLILKRQRYHCKSCNHTFWERLDHSIDEKRSCTHRLLAYIEQRCFDETFVKIASAVGLHEKTIRNIFRDYISRLDLDSRFYTPEWLGIEVHHSRKPILILTDVKKRKVIDLLHGLEVLGPRLLDLPKREHIHIVSLPLVPVLKAVVQSSLPQATLVVYRSHIINIANSIIITMARQIKRNLSFTKREKLLQDQDVLSLPFEHLTSHNKDVIRYWEKELPVLIAAYKVKISFMNVLESDNSDEAARKYTHWKGTIPSHLQKAFEPLILAFDQWGKEIFEGIAHPAPTDYSTFVEGLIDQIAGTERGYSFEAIRAKNLLRGSTMQ